MRAHRGHAARRALLAAALLLAPTALAAVAAAQDGAYAFDVTFHGGTVRPTPQEDGAYRAVDLVAEVWNTGTQDLNVGLLANEATGSIRVSFPFGTSVHVLAGQVTSALFDVEAGPEVPAGTYIVVLTAVLEQDPSVSRSVEVPVEIEAAQPPPTTYGVALSFHPDETGTREAFADSGETFWLSATNTGSTTATLVIRTEEPTGRVDVIVGTGESQEVSAGLTAGVHVHVAPRADTPDGTYVVQVQAAVAESPSTTDSLELTLVYARERPETWVDEDGNEHALPAGSRGVHDLAITPASTDVEVPSGGEGSLVVTVENRGNHTHTVRLGMPPGNPTPFTVTPSTLTLAPGASRDIVVTWAVPAEAPEGAWFAAILQATLLVDGQDAQSYPFPLAKVTVGEASGASLTAGDGDGGGKGESGDDHDAPREQTARLLAGVGIAAGVVAGLGALGLLARRRESLRYALLAPFLPLYTRLAKRDVLDHATRARIHALIEARPGITYTDVLAETRLQPGAVLHHVRTLERHALVLSRREGSRRRFYPVGRRLPEADANPLTPAESRVLALIGPGGLTQREIADRLGLTQQGANYHVKSLERKGRLAVVRAQGGEWRCMRVGAHEEAEGAAEAAPAPRRIADRPR